MKNELIVVISIVVHILNRLLLISFGLSYTYGLRIFLSGRVIFYDTNIPVRCNYVDCLVSVAVRLILRLCRRAVATPSPVDGPTVDILSFPASR
jgi:hypothetical protein